MKVAYISSAAFSDVDFSLLSCLQDYIDIVYFLQLYPNELKGATVNIHTIYHEDGIYSYDVYPELYTLAKSLSKAKLLIYNSTQNRICSIGRIKASYRFYKYIKSNKFDVIHCTWFPDFTLFWLYFFRKKLVFTIHDPLPHSSLRSKTQLFYRWLTMKLGKNFILLNKAQCEDFLSHYRINTNIQNVFFSKLSCYSYLNLYDNGNLENRTENYILFFGKISSYKGLRYLLPAMDIVHKKFPDIKLIIAGSGQFEFDISKYNVRNNIEIRNRFIPESELVELIRGSKFVVAPYTDATQSGVVMSSYAFAKPCIVTNVGALPESVKHMQNGLVVESSNVDALADAICYLLSNDYLLELFTQKIQEEYSSGEMSWQYIAKGICQVYNEMCI